MGSGDRSTDNRDVRDVGDATADFRSDARNSTADGGYEELDMKTMEKGRLGVGLSRGLVSR